MDDFASIDIGGKNLTVSAEELEKVSSPAGCHLELVTDKVLAMDDNASNQSESADELAVGADCDELQSLRPSDKEERMRREYLSILLNANCDPLGPGTRFGPKGDDSVASKQNKLIKARPVAEELPVVHSLTSNTQEDIYVGIHRMYENLGNYEERIQSFNYEEVSQNRVYKKKRLPGVEVPVTVDSLVIYNCAFWTENSKEPFDSTWLRRNTLTTHLATDSILPGLYELLLTTKEGELCEAFLRPEAAFGPLGARPRIPPNATIFCLLEIVKVLTRDKIESLLVSSYSGQPGLTFKDFYDAADESRRRGNYFFSREKYKIASRRYKSGIRILESLTCKDEQEEKLVNELLIKLHNNCARAANADGNPRAALAACKQAADIDNMVPKTHWHRLSAWKKKGHLDRALGVARRAMQLFNDPKVSGPFARAAEELKAKLQSEESEMADLHRLMGRALLA